MLGVLTSFDKEGSANLLTAKCSESMKVQHALTFKLGKEAGVQAVKIKKSKMTKMFVQLEGLFKIFNKDLTRANDDAAMFPSTNDDGGDDGDDDGNDGGYGGAGEVVVDEGDDDENNDENPDDDQDDDAQDGGGDQGGDDDSEDDDQDDDLNEDEDAEAEEEKEDNKIVEPVKNLKPKVDVKVFDKAPKTKGKAQNVVKPSGLVKPRSIFQAVSPTKAKPKVTFAHTKPTKKMVEDERIAMEMAEKEEVSQATLELIRASDLKAKQSEAVKGPDYQQELNNNRIINEVSKLDTNVTTKKDSTSNVPANVDDVKKDKKNKGGPKAENKGKDAKSSGEQTKIETFAETQERLRKEIEERKYNENLQLASRMLGTDPDVETENDKGNDKK